MAALINTSDLPGAGDNSDAPLKIALQLTFEIIGAVAVLIITIGAFRLIVSRGNPEGLNRARNTIIYAAIGLVVSIAAYSIVTFVVGKL